VLAEVDKLRQLRALDVPGDVFAGVDHGLVQLYRQRAAVELPSQLRAHPASIRATLLAALAYQRSREVTGGLVDLLIQVIYKIGVRAEKPVEKELLNDQRRVTGKCLRRLERFPALGVRSGGGPGRPLWRLHGRRLPEHVDVDRRGYYLDGMPAAVAPQPSRVSSKRSNARHGLADGVERCSDSAASTV
jgi:hypothetical protein